MRRLALLLMLVSLAGIAHATVPAVPYTVTYTCSGGFGPFAFTFPISAPTALQVNLNGVVLASTNYTIVPVNANFNNGGSVTLSGSYPCNSGSTLILTRVTPIDQTVQFYDNMPSLPMITGRSVDKLTEISQELNGLVGQIITAAGIKSIQMQNSGVNFGTPMTGLGTLNFSGCTVSGTSPNFTITCSGGGGGGSFSAITSGTNTTAAMVVGTGASLDETGAGTIDANKILTRLLVGFTGSGTYMATATNNLSGASGTPLCEDGSGNIKDSGCSLGTILKTNGSNNSSQTTLNFVNPSTFNGLTTTFSNPTSGNETFTFGGSLNSAGMSSLVSAGSCTNCALSIDLAGRVTGYSNGSTGSGTVTTFSAGTLSPLFTTSVSNPTTTPALSFTLSNFPADNIYGNFTAGSAAPSTQTIPACVADGAHMLTYPSHTLTCTAIASGVANTTTTTNTSALTAGECTDGNGGGSGSTRTVTMTGLTTAMTVQFTPTSDVSTVTGWGSSGGLKITPWPSSSNTLSYHVCNVTLNTITPGGSVTWNLSAK